MGAEMRIVAAASGEELDWVRRLFVEYAESLSFSLCFQSFDAELASLPGDYAPPSGCLLLAYIDDAPCGCVAVRPLSDGACELKRLYVQPAGRGSGAGRALCLEAMHCARAAGYRAMRLDTVPGDMDAAIELYRRLGFLEIPPYRANPIPGALYFERTLVD